MALTVVTFNVICPFLFFHQVDVLLPQETFLKSGNIFLTLTTGLNVPTVMVVKAVLRRCSRSSMVYDALQALSTLELTFKISTALKQSFRRPRATTYLRPLISGDSPSFASEIIFAKFSDVLTFMAVSWFLDGHYRADQRVSLDPTFLSSFSRYTYYSTNR